MKNKKMKNEKMKNKYKKRQIEKCDFNVDNSNFRKTS